MDNEEQSRVDFIAALRGPVRIARELGLSSHSVVSNWSRYGFPQSKKEKLRLLAARDGVEPHPELMVSKPSWSRREPTPASLFMKALVKAYGGVDKLSAETSIPPMSIMTMRKRDKGIMPSYVPTLETAAEKAGVALPEGWEEERIKHKRIGQRRERKTD